MIDFEQELAKFEPSQEIGQLKEDILGDTDKITDMTDIMTELLREIKGTK